MAGNCTLARSTSESAEITQISWELKDNWPRYIVNGLVLFQVSADDCIL